ncbi:hypothetical protein GGI25_000539 [Coemansia spiralis]|uniref:Chitin-binding type-4 domain-containing protein n=2 Tax=Coemansia TaxID=4863 RepID=A0A9W8GEH8_9FUNG|nr:hypothetical protein EDC05_000368 [Coemansia umbellata]KAJ2625443.1 hypothetical protein GGI26_000583 [Coemansia sp. RSA 1358]KAJ2680566.1 hypothetical protein GGI25_000539 [Coemansia spiralis]
MLLNIATFTALAATIAAHMTFIHPCARYSPDSFCPSPPSGEEVDWDMTTAIGSEGEAVSPICKHKKPYPSPVAIWSTGSTQNIEFSDGTGHEGGHCQFSISYDGGKTFVVLSEVLKYCFYNGPSDSDSPSVLNYNVPLPENLPGSEHAVFAWTWVNASGNREFYMNCADVAIIGPAGSFAGKQMTILNYPGYPIVPEFLGNYNTGLEYYANATQITITGAGYSGSSSSSTISITKPASTSSTKTTDATSGEPVLSTAAESFGEPSSSSNIPPASGQCMSANNGQYKCVRPDTSAAFNICSDGSWMQSSCAAGTVCKQSGATVYCDYA